MSGGQLRQRDVDIFDAGPQLGTLQWFAITTRSRHEKMVVEQLDRQRIESFLPLVKQIHKWSDRQKEVELPLFSGYTFVRLIFGSPDRLRVLKTYGVAGFVGMGGMATAVPEAQIENVKTLLANQIPMRDHPFLQIGQRVRIRGGALDGIEGILSAQNGDRKLVISIEPLHRSLSIGINGYDFDPI